MAIEVRKEAAAPNLLAPLLVGLAAGALWIGMQGSSLEKPLFLVLVAQVALFLLLLKRPVWAVASLVVGQLTSSDYMLNVGSTAISARLLWAVLVFALFIPLLAQRGITLGRGAKRILLPALVFFTLATLSNWVNTDIAYTIKYLRQAITSLVILLVVPVVIFDRKDIKILASVTLLTAFASAVVAVMQHYSFRGLPVYTLYPGAFAQGRSLGLTESPIHLNYDLPLVLLLMLGVYLIGGLGRRGKMMLALIALVMAAATYFTYTRSAVLALGIGALSIALLLKGRLRLELLLLLILLGGIFWYYADLRGNRYSLLFEGDTGSAASRVVLWQAGVAMARDNPLLGVGYDQFIEQSGAYASAVSATYLEMGGSLGKQQIHNDFLRVLVSFGLPALLAFLALLLGTFLNYLEAFRRARDNLIRGLSLGAIGALAAYTVNAATHNLMDSVFLLWILAGLSIAIVRLAGGQKSGVALEGRALRRDGS